MAILSEINLAQCHFERCHRGCSRRRAGYLLLASRRSLSIMTIMYSRTMHHIFEISSVHEPILPRNSDDLLTFHLANYVERGNQQELEADVDSF